MITQRFWQIITDIRFITILGLLALAALILIGVTHFDISWMLIATLLVILLLGWLVVLLYRKWESNQASSKLSNMLEQQAKIGDVQQSDLQIIRKRMLAAIDTIKRSKLGILSGASALYELPWYMVIGNPAAGKSTAIAQSGLQFPFADNQGKAVQGIGGTRNCDWFFTTDGILIDTAGRYSVYEEDRQEWFGFLSLLKKHRALAPINGIIIAVSVSELTSNKPEFGIELAKNLRQRVQELTEQLEVFAPVYVMFTKADLIAGFSEFFSPMDNAEREHVWGATFPYQLNHSNDDVMGYFDSHFDELYDGLKQMSLANMSMQRGQSIPTGVFSFPLEFAAIKQPLRAFIATLFEDNPFQFKPVFRGYYFTSAVQEGEAISASSDRVASRFNLQALTKKAHSASGQQGYFLLDLFRKVICADKRLVSQYASRTKTRLKYTAFLITIGLVGLSLAAWSWSYMANRQLVANVEADLEKAVKLQEHKLDLQSRFEALDVLEQRIEQLEKYDTDRPLSLSFGLYQGEILERKLREEYFLGIKEIMLKPVSANLESFLTEVNAANNKLTPSAPVNSTSANGASVSNPTDGVAPVENGNTTHALFKEVSRSNVEDAYNALKTYLMLNDKAHVETGHLNDQLTRYWRAWLEANRGNMTRDQMIRSAEHVINFYLTQVEDPSWPTIETKPALVDQTQEHLRAVVHGMPARERVYAEVKARASTRFPSVTVANIVGDLDKTFITGSYAIPGTFTRDAWENYIAVAFKEAANKETHSTDWVLKSSNNDDLTLEGSPEQIQKALVDQYKAEYTKQWQMFLQGISISELSSFEQATNAMNRLGDPQTSPVSKVINTVYTETSWDNPSLVSEALKRSQRGVIEWFKEVVLRQTPSSVNVSVNMSNANQSVPMGPVGKEFSGISKLVVVKNQDTSLLSGYLNHLSKLRSRFNQIKNQGDTGPGAKQLMQQTLDGNGSELAEALKFVDEQMLVGMTDSQKLTLRPLLVRPLMQGFAVLIKPSESEVNKLWSAQVYEPFQKNLASKYPFNPGSNIEANGTEIAQMFGTEGAIAKFFDTSIASLIIRRGDTISEKTWANMGVHISPVASHHFNSWVAPLSASGVPTVNPSEAQWVFQLLPGTAPGTTEYTIEVDGQQLRYRNTQAQWTNLVWPNTQGVPGAKIIAITFDGRSIEVANFPGKFGFKRLMDAASNKRKEGGIFELSWSKDNITVTADLKIISRPDASTESNNPQSTGFKGMKIPSTVLGTSPDADSSSVTITPPPAQSVTTGVGK